MSTLHVHKSYPPGPLSDSVVVNLHPSATTASLKKSLKASLSGSLDDYNILTSPSGLHISAHAKKPYQDRYRSAEKRLSAVEDKLQKLLKDKEYNESVLLRSQVYSNLLLIIQNQMFSSLSTKSQQDLRTSGLADLPRMFAIWWTAWNSRDPVNFPLPEFMSQLTIHLPLGNSLFNRYGGESAQGVILRKAWEMLEPVSRDLMMHCWCGKMSGINIRNPLAHPITYKEQAQQILSNDLQDKLSYLHFCALTNVSDAPDIFIV